MPSSPPSKRRKVAGAAGGPQQVVVVKTEEPPPLSEEELKAIADAERTPEELWKEIEDITIVDDATLLQCTTRVEKMGDTDNFIKFWNHVEKIHGHDETQKWTIRYLELGFNRTLK
jgi:hypothetical protein